MRRATLLATTLLTPMLLGLAIPAAAQPVTETSAVRVRTGQHTDRGRVVLHLGEVPPYSLRKVAGGVELRLRGQHRFDLSGTRRLTELAGIETRQEGGDTVLLLRAGNEAVAEAGAFGGMLYVDLRGAAAPPPTREAAQRRTLDEAVKLGLIQPSQAQAMLQAARDGETEAQGPVTQTAQPPSAPAPAPAAVLQAPPPAARPAVSAGDLTALRDAVLARLAVLNGIRPAGTLPPLPAAAPDPVPPAEAPPAAAAPAPAPALPRPACPAPFTLRGWGGGEAFSDRLPLLRAALARSDQGAAEAADLAEFYAGHELSREALDVLNAPQAELPAGALRERLDRVRDIARLLLGRPIQPDSPLLADTGDCAREDLPLWQALAAATSGDGATLAALAPRARAALRDVPQALRLTFVQRLADAVENDPTTLRTLLGAVRPATGLTPAQAAARNWQYARLARQDGNRADEAQYLEMAVRGPGRTLPEILARARLAALTLGRPGAEGRRAEAQINDLLRTYRHDTVGEEAAIAYATQLLEQGALAQALAVADGASQASARRVESRGAVLAASTLRRLLAETSPLPADERLGLFWQYEGYATPGERGDDIRLAAMRLLLQQGLADAARDLGQQVTPASARGPAAILLLARAEAVAAQGDPRRALALLAGLPQDAVNSRIGAEALARLGRPEEAAAQLEPLRGTPDLARRAELLFEARAWRAAGTAYAVLLRDPDLPASARADATSRLANASALARERADVAPELLAPGTATAALLRLTETPAAPGTGIANVRNAIERSRQIEALLPPAEGT